MSGVAVSSGNGGNKQYTDKSTADTSATLAPMSSFRGVLEKENVRIA